MNSKNSIHALLSVFIGLLVAGFIGLGIAALYSAPAMPEYPTDRYYSDSADTGPSEEYKQKMDAYDVAYREYQETSKGYSRTVSVIALVCSVLVLLLSLILLQGTQMIGDGITLGGIFLLVYGMVLAGGSNDVRFQFLAVAVGLAVTLALSYIKFVRPSRKVQA
jgi:hypothetical protein